MAQPVLVDTATRLTDATFYGKVQITGGSGTVTSLSPGSANITLTPNPITSTGTIDLTIPVTIAAGGSGQTTANAALNAFLPTQAGQAGKQLQTDGANTSWAAAGGGSVSSISAGSAAITLTPNPITLTGTIDLTAPVTVPYGGTGVITLAAGYVKSSGTSPFTSQAVPIPVTDGGTGNITLATGAYLKGAAGAAITTQAAPIPVTDGGTGTVTQFTQGSVVYAGASGVYSQDNANAFWDGTNHRLGLATATPNVTLDVAGAIATRKLDIAVVNGLNSNIALTNASWVRLTGPTGVFSIGGFTNPYDGRVLNVYNTVSQTMTVVNEDASSTAANRITTTTGGNVALGTGKPSIASFRYDATASRWIMTNAWNYAVAGAGDIKSDGSVSMAAPWNTYNYPINSQNSWALFNVVAYGADPTGTSSSVTAFQNAVNAVHVGLDYNGGVIFIPPGTYKLDGTITVPSGVTFLGAGNWASRLLNYSHTLDIFVLTRGASTLSVAPVTFENLGFTTDYPNYCTAGAMIHQVSGSTAIFPVYIKNCYFGYHYYGVELESSEFSVIRDTIFLNPSSTAGGAGVYIHSTTSNGLGDNFIDCCEFSGNSNSYGILQDYGAATRISNCEFGGTHLNCIYLATPAGVGGGTSVDLYVTNCKFEDATNYSITIVPASSFSNIVITGNHFGDTAGGISIAPTAAGSAAGGIIVGNYFIGGSTSSINFNPGAAGGANVWLVEANTFNYPTTAAITLPGTPANCTNLTVGPNQYYPGAASQYISGTFDTTSGFAPIYAGTGAAAAGGTPWDSLLTISQNIYPPRVPLATNQTLIHLIGADTIPARILADAYGSVGGSVVFRQAGGTNQTPTASTSGLALGSFQLYGYGSTGYSAAYRSAAIFAATETWTDTAQGTKCQIATTPTGTTTTTTVFTVENDGSVDTVARGLTGYFPMVIFRQKATSTTTANTLTTLFGSGNGTLTLPASWLIVASMVKFKIWGYISTADGGAGTKTLVVKLGATTLFTATSGATFTTVLNAPWTCEGEIVCYSVGAPGTVHANAKWQTQIATATPDGVMGSTTAAVNVTTTGALALDVLLNNGNATGVSTTLGAYVEVIP